MNKMQMTKTEEIIKLLAEDNITVAQSYKMLEHLSEDEMLASLIINLSKQVKDYAYMVVRLSELV